MGEDVLADGRVRLRRTLESHRVGPQRFVEVPATVALFVTRVRLASLLTDASIPGLMLSIPTHSCRLESDAIFDEVHGCASCWWLRRRFGLQENDAGGRLVKVQTVF